jgi:hypothetical protein
MLRKIPKVPRFHFILLSTTNEMERYKIFCIIFNVVHVSGGSLPQTYTTLTIIKNIV